MTWQWLTLHWCLLVDVQDLAGLRMGQLTKDTIKMFKAMSAVYQDHYPVCRMFLCDK